MSKNKLENMLKLMVKTITVLALMMVFSFFSFSEEVKDAAASYRNEDVNTISKELSNPVSSIYVFPFEFDFNFDAGPEYGKINILNIQPVIPINLGNDWKVIIRTIVPLVQEKGMISDETVYGVGDIEQSFFFAPNKSEGIIWGVGPIVNIPSGNDKFSSKKWGLGPSAVMVSMNEKVTYGGLAEHMWSIGGEGPKDINMTMVQPFIAYRLGNGWSVSTNVEITYDWVDDQFIIPWEVGVGKVIKIANVIPVSIGIAPRYYIERSDFDPRWGVRLTMAVIL